MPNWATPRSHRSPAGRSILVLISLLALAGCQEDEITHAVVPRAAEPERTRLVGVIYPHGEETWFFKLTGLESAFDGIDKPFAEFMDSIQFTDKGNPPLTWTLPEGWKQEEAGRMVAAAFRAGAPDKPLKLTVSVLPRKPENELLDNVNRWRGQLGLDPVSEAELEALKKDNHIQTLKINGTDVFWVDMIGSGGARKMARGPDWTYQAPDGWVAAPHPEAGIVPREALFQITDGGQTAEASVTALGGAAGGLESNVERWVRQIDAAPPAPDQFKQLPTVAVAGRQSPYVDLTGKNGRTLGAIVARGDKTWFFKLTGPADLVEKQKPKFDEFLQSVKFDGGMGGEQ